MCVSSSVAVALPAARPAGRAQRGLSTAVTEWGGPAGGWVSTFSAHRARGGLEALESPECSNNILTMARCCTSLLAGLALVAAQDPASAVIRSGVAWYDTAGERMYAGGANIYKEGDTFYLVGEGKKTLGSDCSACFNQYSSVDLENWTPLGCVMKNQDVVAPPPYNKENFYRIERPKILKCPGTTTSPYRLIFHCDTADFSMKSIGILSSDSVTGPFSFMKPCFRPDNQDSYDMGTYVDDRAGGDGKAYLIRSVQVRTVCGSRPCASPPARSSYSHSLPRSACALCLPRTPMLLAEQVRWHQRVQRGLLRRDGHRQLGSRHGGAGHHA